MKYRVELLPGVERTLNKMDPQVRRRVFRAIQDLEDDPRPPQAKALQGSYSGHHRVRVGDWRVVYKIEDRQLTVLVIRVGHRSEIYKLGVK